MWNVQFMGEILKPRQLGDYLLGPDYLFWCPGCDLPHGIFLIDEKTADLWEVEKKAIETSLESVEWWSKQGMKSESDLVGIGSEYAIWGRHNFDGNFEMPTFSMAFLQIRHNFEGKWKEKIPPNVVSTKHETQTAPRCHYIIKGGNIKYFSDCEHKLFGQTVKMIEFPELMKIPMNLK